MPYLEYAKIWTRTLEDAWFMSLTGIERGVFLQFIIMAKGAENSAPKFKSWRAMGLACGVDGKSVRKIVGKFRTNGKIYFTEDENGIIEVRIAKFLFWQSLKPNKEGRETLRKIPHGEEKSTELPHLQKQEANKTEAVVTPAQQLLANFNDWMVRNKDDIVSAFEVGYAHVGGVSMLRSVADEIREAILMCPTDIRWEQHRNNQTWGNCIRAWNRNKIRAGETS